MRPPNAELLAHLIVLKQWPSFVYIHDSDYAEQGLQFFSHIFISIFNLQQRKTFSKSTFTCNAQQMRQS